MPNEDGAPYQKPAEDSGNTGGNITKKKNVTLTAVGPPGTDGIRTVPDATRRKVMEEAETYEKVVMESEREAGLNDTVDTTTIVPEDDETEETQQENYTDLVCIVGVVVLLFVMVFTSRKQQKAEEKHQAEHEAINSKQEGQEKEEEEHHDQPTAGTDAAAPAEANGGNSAT
mmetsp:Transcript_81458/g.170363  ORF Transcript_81458/g.170363 Transcript_81458/m.170363 type:complete len:172 (+) Transcript_81458:286-801(+)